MLDKTIAVVKNYLVDRGEAVDSASLNDFAVKLYDGDQGYPQDIAFAALIFKHAYKNSENLQIKQNVENVFRALTYGQMKDLSGIYKKAIEKDVFHREEMAVSLLELGLCFLGSDKVSRYQDAYDCFTASFEGGGGPCRTRALQELWLLSSRIRQNVPSELNDREKETNKARLLIPEIAVFVGQQTRLIDYSVQRTAPRNG